MHGTQAMFVPYKISVADILIVMRDELPYCRTLDVSYIMMELLQNIIFDRIGRYGPFQGPVGAYIQLIGRMISKEDEFEIDVKMHEFESMITDLLCGYFPSMAMQPHNHYFFYPAGETDLVIYVPVTEDLPPALSAKAVPEQAIRSALR